MYEPSQQLLNQSQMCGIGSTLTIKTPERRQ